MQRSITRAAVIGVLGALGCSDQGSEPVALGSTEASASTSMDTATGGEPAQIGADNAAAGGASPGSTSTSTSADAAGGAAASGSQGDTTTQLDSDGGAMGSGGAVGSAGAMGGSGPTAGGGGGDTMVEPDVTSLGGQGAGGSSGSAAIEAAGGATGMGGAGGSSGSGADGGAGGADNGEAGIDLFNGTDLTGWTAYRETASMSPGTELSPSDAEAIFKPEDGAIRVYGDEPDGSEQSRHTLVSDESYENYILTMEYRWGTKVFAPYTDLARYPRDAGLLWHMHGDLTQVWPSSIEFQIKDGTTGDIFALYARCTSLSRNGGTTYVSADDGGTMKLVDGASGFVQHSRSENLEVDGWNSIEMRVDGGTAVYLVNGEIVNEVLSVSDRSGGGGSPVNSGPIALQAEHAEAFYRNIRIQVLP